MKNKFVKCTCGGDARTGYYDSVPINKDDIITHELTADFFIECSNCGKSTDVHDSITGALAEWEKINTDENDFSLLRCPACGLKPELFRDHAKTKMKYLCSNPQCRCPISPNWDDLIIEFYTGDFTPLETRGNFSPGIKRNEKINIDYARRTWNQTVRDWKSGICSCLQGREE